MYKALQALDERITAAEHAADELVKPTEASSREILTVVQQEILIPSYDFSPVRRMFQNGDMNTIVGCRLSAMVTKNPAPSSDVQQRQPLDKLSDGWGRGGVPSSPEFDFQWNYEIASRQSQFVRAPSYLSSDILAGLDRGKMLDFRVPVILPRGEQIAFTVRPLRFLIPTSGVVPTVGATSYYVSFLLIGYRRAP